MNKRAVFIINPVSGMKQSKKYLADILYLFAQNDYECVCLMTRCQGDGVDLACQYAPGADVLVCVGGDGTFTEVASGLIESGCDTPLGYIPAGSTNDFANSLKLPHDMLQAARAIIEGTPHPYDLCRFGDRCFSYIASFGAFTRASYTAPQNLKNSLGHVAYILEGIRELSSLKSEHVRIVLDDGSVFDDYYIFGGFCNSTSIGGVITLDPKLVDMSDGLFEILLIRAPKSPMELSECIRTLREEDYKSEVLNIFSASHAKITTLYDMDWSLDGEHEHSLGTVELSIIHNAVNIIK